MASLLKTGTGPSWLYFWQIWCWKEIGFFKVSNAVCYFSRPGIDPIFDTGLDMRWVGFMPHWWWLPHHCQENKNHVLCSVGSPPSQKDSDVNADIQEIIFRHDITMLCHMLILIIYIYTHSDIIFDIFLGTNTPSIWRIDMDERFEEHFAWLSKLCWGPFVCGPQKRQKVYNSSPNRAGSYFSIFLWGCFIVLYAILLTVRTRITIIHCGNRYSECQP